MDEQFDRILEHTLSDYRVSRGEKRILRSVVDEIDPDDQQLAYMRHQAFKIARREVYAPAKAAPDVPQIGWPVQGPQLPPRDGR